MNCPICHVTLQMTHREDVEIDFCPQCRGIWLDRGELDKIMERSRKDSKETYERYDHEKYRPKRKKSFLEELFD
jgi:uncharacterized protein